MFIVQSEVLLRTLSLPSLKSLLASNLATESYRTDNGGYE